MVDVNPNSSLQSQLQAQLQAKKLPIRPQEGDVGARLRPNDVVDERIKVRGDERRGNRQLPVKQSGRLSELSSARDLDRAKERVTQAAANNREAPAGRRSVRENELRNQPLGQIIDIRV
jgi:hypothetical protein